MLRVTCRRAEQQHRLPGEERPGEALQGLCRRGRRKPADTHLVDAPAAGLGRADPHRHGPLRVTHPSCRMPHDEPQRADRRAGPVRWDAGGRWRRRGRSRAGRAGGSRGRWGRCERLARGRARLGPPADEGDGVGGQQPEDEGEHPERCADHDPSQQAARGAGASCRSGVDQRLAGCAVAGRLSRRALFRHSSGLPRQPAAPGATTPGCATDCPAGSPRRPGPG